MEIHLDDSVPTNLTDAQMKSNVCEWFTRDYLKFSECFIRAELNQAPQNIKTTIEKPVDFNGELIDFADIVIEYEAPKKLHDNDRFLNKSFFLRKRMYVNNLIEQSVLHEYPKTNGEYDKKKTKSLFSFDYHASYLLKNELEQIEKTRERLKKEYQSASINSIANFSPPTYTKFEKECLLISVLPNVEALKADINGAIRRIKTLEYYLKNVTRKHIVYWGVLDDDIQEYLQHEGIELTGLYETLYDDVSKKLKKPDQELKENENLPLGKAVKNAS